MTLPSRKKHPTTAPITRRAKRRTSLFLAGCALAAGSLLSGPLAYLSAQDISEAKPLKIEGTAEQPLRWKAKPISTASREGVSTLATGYSPIGSGVVQAGGETEVTASGKPSGGWNKMRIDTYVTPAQATSPVNPFQDPFGDRGTGERGTIRSASALQLQPPGTQPNPAAPGLNPAMPGFNPPVTPGVIPTQPEVIPSPFQPAPAVPPVVPPTTPGQPDSIVPPNEFFPNPLVPRQPNPVPEGSDPANPRTPDNSSPSNKPCDRIYNDLNCCDSDANCRAFIQRLMQDRLSTISLDITPRLEPNQNDVENEKQRIVRMRLAGKRVWHRRGVTFAQRDTTEPLITGTLHDLHNGRATIIEESGNQREIPLQDLSEDDLCFISGWWKLPAECAIASNRQVDLYNRGWMPSTINWHASALCHKPLYFEQVQHERYGHTAGPLRQPFIDGAHFFGSALLLPYQMALDPPWECEYALGYYRPGSCAPWQIPPFPFSARAAMAQAGFVVGGIHIIP